MSFIKNIKDWFTDLLGAIIMGVSSYFHFWQQTIDLNGWLVCLGVGFVFLWIPDDVILRHLKKKVKKDFDLEEDKEDKV